jgi:hypothetical protein
VTSSHFENNTTLTTGKVDPLMNNNNTERTNLAQLGGDRKPGYSYISNSTDDPNFIDYSSVHCLVLQGCPSF